MSGVNGKRDRANGLDASNGTNGNGARRPEDVRTLARRFDAAAAAERTREAIDAVRMDEDVVLLERRANMVRSRLLRTIDALEARRHQVTEIGHEAKRLAKPAMLTFAAIAAVTAGGALGIGYLLARRRERKNSLLHQLVAIAENLHVEPKPSFAAELLKKVTYTAVTIVTTEVVRRTAKNAFDGRLPDGRLAVAGALDAHHEELSKLSK